MSIPFRVLGSNVAVKVESEEEKEDGGFVFRQSSDIYHTTAEVVAVGPSCASVQAGDSVVFNKFSGDSLEVGGVSFLLLQEDLIRAILLR